MEPSELRKLPQVDRLVASVETDAPRPLTTAVVRAVLDEARLRISDGDPAPDIEDLVGSVRDRLKAVKRSGLSPLINATGVLLHTNLGRAPLHPEALERMRSTGGGYINLEYDLAGRTRGDRYDYVASLLGLLTGAEDAVVVNNNAAAVLLTLSALANHQEVIISRGEMIEIGGEFRIPEILRASGAELIEVGTTNRTHARDYEHAIGPEAAAVMKVHPSNYTIVGFTADVPSSEIARIAKDHELFFIYDIGSGLLRRSVAGAPEWLRTEPAADEEIGVGADIVAFSGDKLLGGPQAGIICGSAHALERLKRNPLLRASRVDKSTLAALEATLEMYLDGRESELPFWRMALTEPADIAERAERIIGHVRAGSATTQLVEGVSTPGGGSGAEANIPTVLIEISPKDITAEELASRLVGHDPAIIARIDHEHVILDLRSVMESQDEEITAALRAAL